MNLKEQYLKVAIKAAHDSSKIFKQYFGKPNTISKKQGNWRELVTEIDFKIEKNIRAILSKNFPSHKIIGEEMGVDKNITKTNLIWIIDPIDGTTNFIKGIPLCCISIALWDGKGPLMAVVYNPIVNELFTAARGQGAFMNGKKISVSKTNSTKESFGALGWGRDINIAKKIFRKVISHFEKLRTLGSGTTELCYTALGRFDFLIHAKLSIWDFAAAVLIVEEAGGKVTDFKNKPVNLNTTALVASNKILHSQILKKL